MSQYSYYKALISFKLLLFHTKVCSTMIGNKFNRVKEHRKLHANDVIKK